MSEAEQVGGPGWATPRMRRVIERLSARSAASVGVEAVGGWGDEQSVETEVLPHEALRRMLADLVELGDVDAVLRYIAARTVNLLNGMGGCSSAQGQGHVAHGEMGQMVVLGLLLAADAEFPVAGVTPLEGAVLPPAHESFADRPAHGGYPGEASS